jgi:exodeoxyribonuclease V alpha subunit
MLKKSTINTLLQKGLLSEIDIYFARFISGVSNAQDPDIFLAAALVSRATGSGDICLNLQRLAAEGHIGRDGEREPIRCPSLAVWLDKLTASPAVGRPGQIRPLILDSKNRLYLYRYWDYENTLANSIKRRILGHPPNLDLVGLKQSLDRLFPKTEAQRINWQKVAAAVCSLRLLSIITGGPGTGKTYTVAKVLALLLEQLPGRPIQIYLAAPTGKAAARLKETIEQAKNDLHCANSIKAVIPSEVFTIHRLLKPIKGSPYFRHNRDNPLTADVVVVDEASMVDLALMAKVFQAVPEEARLILMGDRDQLASVEAGSVLADICGRKLTNAFSAPFIKQLEELSGENIETEIEATTGQSGLRDSIVVLQRSYRFAAGSAIEELSRAVNRAEADRAIAMLDNGDGKTLSFHQLRANKSIIQILSKQIVSGYQPYLQTSDPAQALRRLRRFKILCALNIGPLGAQAVNKLAEQVLSRENLIQLNPVRENPWYAGRPVLITRNDYQVGLFNGDIGIALSAGDARDNLLSVFFPDDAGGVRRFQPYQLPEHETVYAMTVHKSQGSEFDEVLFILPDRDFPVLTRELIYTALTRARKKIAIWGAHSIIRSTIGRKIERTSGLRDALWGG